MLTTTLLPRVYIPTLSRVSSQGWERVGDKSPSVARSLRAAKILQLQDQDLVCFPFNCHWPGPSPGIITMLAVRFHWNNRWSSPSGGTVTESSKDPEPYTKVSISQIVLNHCYLQLPRQDWGLICWSATARQPFSWSKTHVRKPA